MALLGTCKRSVGIRLEGEQAAFVYLARIAGRIRVLQQGVLQLPKGEESSETLALRGRPDEVILGLPRRAVVLRFLELPSIDERDLAGLLAYEIDRHLPFPPDEACYSFHVLEPNGKKARVLLVAARKAEVESCIERVRRLGLRPTAVDVSALAALNAIVPRKRQKSGALALVSVNGRHAEVSVLQNGILEYSRGLPLEEGQPPRLLLQELHRALEGREVQGRILVDGADEEFMGLLGKELGLEVERWDPPVRISGIGKGLDAAALGLALRGVSKHPVKLDLLPQEYRVKRRDPALVTMFALLALIAVLGGALGMTSAYRERKALAKLSRQVQQVKAQAGQAEALKAEFAKLRNQLRFLEGIAGEQGRPLIALKELVGLLPSDVLLNEFIVEERKVQIRGTTTSSASDLISAFERSTLFENAAFTSPIAAQGDRQGFQLQFFIKGR